MKETECTRSITQGREDRENTVAPLSATPLILNPCSPLVDSLVEAGNPGKCRLQRSAYLQQKRKVQGKQEIVQAENTPAL